MCVFRVGVNHVSVTAGKSTTVDSVIKEVLSLLGKQVSGNPLLQTQPRDVSVL